MGFTEFKIRINHRGLIKAIAEKAGVNDADGLLVVQRALDFSDKVTKFGLDGIRDDLNSYGAPPRVIDIIIEMLEIAEERPLAKLDSIKNALDFSEAGRKATDELTTIMSLLPDDVLDQVSIDLTLARGADYYTGFILEGTIDTVPVGAVLGGGRYDNLVGKFSNSSEPAVGMAFGLERIVTAMKLLGKFDSVKLQQRVLVAGGSNTNEKWVLDVVTQLRRVGISVDYVPHGTVIDAIKYGDYREFSAVVILEGDEIHKMTHGDDELLAVVSPYFN